MTNAKTLLLAAFSLPLLTAASCSGGMGGDSAAPASTGSAGDTVPYTISEHGTYDEPWAIAFIPGTDLAFITELPGTARIVDTSGENPRLVTVSGLPDVDYGGQGGLGDVAFLPSESADRLDTRTIYLSFAEAGSGDTRGAAVGRGTLKCYVADECTIEDWQVIWRQAPKVTGRGHYSHRIAFSPDERYMFIASGERQKKDPAQDNTNNLGTIVRLNLDGTPAAGNPYPRLPAPTNQIWSYGHRNILGLQFDDAGRLWDLEHGPAGGDELNLVEAGNNYGWPLVSNGDNYNGSPIPDNDTRPDLVKPVIGWTPVIAPGDFIFYSGDAFPAWRGDALIVGLKTEALIRVAMDGTRATEAGRYDFGKRLRDIAQGPDGAVWIIEDGEGGRLLKLSPAS
ncbi:PQQ-dependent sugar dehydrogenase [Alteriqipengyuania sp. WL0013]|uniref:PQQ-dependent sugar dehydrogenase n=1 Tax=Alteriqipengyuania sp. WL0013 TaxID=3110773 RepID=UPI002CACD55C|nr:PQQ-dependent sugar dehydrogenase [Alteriqipengyuania sp. WL0013]MEB3415451.1 PQQ-dependent sugar dehydrogenase [Alteriqipengyuania sp. WL0013]